MSTSNSHPSTRRVTVNVYCKRRHLGFVDKQIEFLSNTVSIPWEFTKFEAKGIGFPAKIHLTLEDEDYLRFIK
ncbi:MAG: hypothetical protein PVG70_02695 [Desulfobacterales bacterium]